MAGKLNGKLNRHEHIASIGEFRGRRSKSCLVSMKSPCLSRHAILGAYTYNSFNGFSRSGSEERLKIPESSVTAVIVQERRHRTESCLVAKISLGILPYLCGNVGGDGRTVLSKGDEIQEPGLYMCFC